jgi:hypothetical protein
MIKKIIGIILQAPMYLLILGSLIASFYAAYEKIQGITWSTPIVISVIIISYIVGKMLMREQ